MQSRKQAAIAIILKRAQQKTSRALVVSPLNGLEAKALDAC